MAKLGNFLRLDRYDVEFPKYDKNEENAKATLVNVFRGDAVAGLLHIRRADEDFLLLVEQFRMPTLIDPETGMPDLDKVHEGEHAGRLLELMAGMQKPGEPWLEAFRRECFEETNLQPDRVEFITSYYPSPGACSERIHLYYGRVEVPPDTPLLDHEHEDDESYGDDTEDIRRVFMKPEAFLEAVEQGEIQDGKALAAAEWMRRKSSAEKMDIELK